MRLRWSSCSEAGSPVTAKTGSSGRVTRFLTPRHYADWSPDTMAKLMPKQRVHARYSPVVD
jgi:hypothetical protein